MTTKSELIVYDKVYCLFALIELFMFTLKAAGTKHALKAESVGRFDIMFTHQELKNYRYIHKVP